MNLELLNLIISLCVGSVDTQVCHKNIISCHSTKKSSDKVRVLKCYGPGTKEGKKCMDDSGGAEKNDAEVIAECAAK